VNCFDIVWIIMGTGGAVCHGRLFVIMCAVLYQLTCVNLMHVKRALRLISRASERH